MRGIVIGVVAFIVVNGSQIIAFYVFLDSSYLIIESIIIDRWHILLEFEKIRVHKVLMMHRACILIFDLSTVTAESKCSHLSHR